jgi:hypothetical protein
MLGNQEISADEQEDDQGNVSLGLHHAIVVRFTLVFHKDSLLYLEQARQGCSHHCCLVQQQ